MIKLTKGAQPDILRRKAQEWTQAILDKQARGEVLTKTDRGHYRHDEIKEALIAETNGKCAYCESKVRHITYGDIEHITPKSHNPNLWFSWDNLTLACDVCNTNKGDHTFNFVDPYEDPSSHLMFLGPIIFPCPGSNAGAITETTLVLNRGELVERRKERLGSLSKHLEVIARTDDPNLRGILERDLLEEEAADKEFAGMVREAIKLYHAKGFISA